MAWLSTTRWINKKVNNLQEGIDALFTNEHEIGSYGSTSYVKKSMKKEFEDNKIAEINGREIEYNVVSFIVDAITPGDDPEESRTMTINGLIIVYYDNGNTNYIINRNYDAHRLLVRFCNYDGRNEIVENKIVIPEDLFMWSIYKVFNSESVLEFTEENQTEKTLKIDAIMAVRGETLNENKVSVRGNTLLDLISTLSFILESGLLNQIILRIEYESHETIEIRLSDKGVIAVELNSYSGTFEDYESSKRKANLLLLIYIDLLPKLRNVYFTEEGDWITNLRQDFYTKVKEDLIEKIEVAQEASLQSVVNDD